MLTLHMTVWPQSIIRCVQKTELRNTLAPLPSFACQLSFFFLILTKNIIGIIKNDHHVYLNVETCWLFLLTVSLHSMTEWLLCQVKWGQCNLNQWQKTSCKADLDYSQNNLLNIWHKQTHGSFSSICFWLRDFRGNLNWSDPISKPHHPSKKATL